MATILTVIYQARIKFNFNLWTEHDQDSEHVWNTSLFSDILIIIPKIIDTLFLYCGNIHWSQP